jgi:hypothetical protein
VDDEWFEHGGYRTYRIAGLLDSISKNPQAYARELEALTLDEAIYNFLQPWSKTTMLHAFARFVADMLFYEDLEGPRVYRVLDDNTWAVTKRILPVDHALIGYGFLALEEAFAVPAESDETGRIQLDEDAAYDYFCGNLRWSELYDPPAGAHGRRGLSHPVSQPPAPGWAERMDLGARGGDPRRARAPCQSGRPEAKDAPKMGEEGCLPSRARPLRDLQVRP